MSEKSRISPKIRSKTTTIVLGHLLTSSSDSLRWGLLLISSSSSSEGFRTEIFAGLEGSGSSRACLEGFLLASASGSDFGRTCSERFRSGTGVSSRDSSEASEAVSGFLGSRFGSKRASSVSVFYLGFVSGRTKYRKYCSDDHWSFFGVWSSFILLLCCNEPGAFAPFRKSSSSWSRVGSVLNSQEGTSSGPVLKVLINEGISESGYTTRWSFQQKI